MNVIKQSQNGKYGILDFSFGNIQFAAIDDYKDLTRIVLLKSGSITIDFKEFSTDDCNLLFIRPGQYIQVKPDSGGRIIYYTPHLYAQDIDDHDLVFGGMLFNGKEEQPGLKLDQAYKDSVESFINKIALEMSNPDDNQEAMIRAVIKQLIVTSTRIWRQQYGRLSLVNRENDFSRFFDRLVEHNFLKFHSVADYANMLNISPKALNKRVSKFGNCTPGAIIRRRIILEAKRMLIHTPMSVKEISYKLGYDDPSYFIRFFGKQVNMPPQNYRRYFQSGLNAVA